MVLCPRNIPGKAEINLSPFSLCWNLADAETFRREKAAMAFGVAQWPAAEGRLLFHEYAPGQEREAAGALAAWRYLLRL